MIVFERCGSKKPSGPSRPGSGIGVGIAGTVPVIGRVGYFVKVYVGRRFKYFPRLGTNNEFCTLLSVLRVDTSGSTEVSICVRSYLPRDVTYQEYPKHRVAVDHIQPG